MKAGAVPRSPIRNASRTATLITIRNSTTWSAELLWPAGVLADGLPAGGDSPEVGRTGVEYKNPREVGDRHPHQIRGERRFHNSCRHRLVSSLAQRPGQLRGPGPFSARSMAGAGTSTARNNSCSSRSCSATRICKRAEPRPESPCRVRAMGPAAPSSTFDDDAAPPARLYPAPLPNRLDTPQRPGKMKGPNGGLSTILPTNWKLAMEAFHGRPYHTMADPIRSCLPSETARRQGRPMDRRNSPDPSLRLQPFQDPAGKWVEKTRSIR